MGEQMDRSLVKEINGLVVLSALRIGLRIFRSASRTFTGNPFKRNPVAALRKSVKPLPSGWEKSVSNVAILIPVYNNWKWTKRCLESLKRANEVQGIDIWVVDDCSNDGTVEKLMRTFPDVKIIQNKENLGFLRSCNAAFAQLQSRYGLFYLLNNDTEVLPGFLVEAKLLLDTSPKISMVGSRLLFPNGKLQEAGGLIWRSGNAWNFGRGDYPGKPEYLVDRQIDYASGAALLIKTDALKEVGYFSPEFVPAYCEDSDLAFKLRAKGHQVWLAAKSNVIHFEGKSNGTSLSNGIKAYQEPNQLRLRAKWAKELESHFEESTHSGAQAAFRLSPARLPSGNHSADPLESFFQLVLEKASSGSGIEKPIAVFLLRLKDFYLANASEVSNSTKHRRKRKPTSSFSDALDSLFFEHRGDPNFSPDSNLVALISVQCQEIEHIARAYRGLISSLGGQPLREVRVLNFSGKPFDVTTLSTNPNVKNLKIDSHTSKGNVLDAQIEELTTMSVLHISCCSVLASSFLFEAQSAMQNRGFGYVVGKALFSDGLLGEAGIQELNHKVTNPALGAPRDDTRFDFGRSVSRLGSSPWLKRAGIATRTSEARNVWFEPRAVSYFQRTTDELVSIKPEKPSVEKSLDWLFGHKSSGVILMIEDEIPKPDRHAGDVTVSQYLDVFLSEGFSVIYWPRHHSGWSSYRQTLLDKGVWVLDSNTNAELWFSTYGHTLEAVWVARIHNATRLTPLIRKFSNARIVYYTHDLHFLREERQSSLETHGQNQALSSKTKEIESAIFKSVDVVASPSESESLIIRELAPSTEVVTIPPYFITSSAVKHFGGKSTDVESVIFVGGFPHTPNVDAALMLALEVMPFVWRSLPNTKLFLVGYAPPPQVLALANERVIVTGQVPDLEPYLLNSSVFCAPLTFGAGVKGKVVDALRFGLPVVGTSIAFEGMDIESDRDCLVAESPQDLAAAIIKVLSNKDLAKKLGTNGQLAARIQFSRELGIKQVREMMLTKRRLND
ncbi:MAG: hypothetical protein RJB63_188 [Actinomycetota bacterium]|jgi:GT2 family glycosyltransferase/glycosyltransferase involved in cell wall biosynthesis